MAKNYKVKDGKIYFETVSAEVVVDSKGRKQVK